MGLSQLPRKICVISHGGTKNLGDEALFATVVQNVRRRVPDAEILGFTISPDDTRKRHGIPCFPIRRSAAVAPTPAASPVSEPAAAPSSSPRDSTPSRGLRGFVKSIPGVQPFFSFLRTVAGGAVSALAEPRFLIKSYRRLKGAQLLIAAGGQQLNDGYGGPWGYPFTLYKWTLLAKLTGTKVVLLSVGAGPIDSPLSKFFFRRTLNLVDYRSYRDAISSQLMISLGIKGEHPVFPDLVYSLRLPEPRPFPTNLQQVIVGTNPVPFFGEHYWPNPDAARYQDYVRKLARFAEWLDASGHSVLFFPTQLRADVITINDINAAMNGAGRSPNFLQQQPIHNLEDLVSEIARADLIVANRYHAILISLMMNKPVLGIAYHEKSRALLEQAGQGDYVLKIDNFKTEDLIERFKSLEANAPAIKKRIVGRMAPLREALERQYDVVFGLVGIKPAEKESLAR
jgi:polysaccharide pyruvyl transferase WcaK-like protein